MDRFMKRSNADICVQADSVYQYVENTLFDVLNGRAFPVNFKIDREDLLGCLRESIPYY